jgi:hypothetical protein
MVLNLQTQGYFVLVASDADHALNIVRLHSRPIHILLTDSSSQGKILASAATEYRKKMSVVFVSGDHESSDGSYSTDEALRVVRQLVFALKQQPREALSLRAAGAGSAH